MTVKMRLKVLFNENRGKYLSGEQLAKELDVSRNAVCKAVKSLQQEGYKIEAVTNKGYLLSNDTDVVTSEGILSKIDAKYSAKMKIEVQKSITSTNTVLKARANDGEVEYSVIVAEEQTAGLGRKGRNFHSPNNTGVYFSILLKPTIEPAKATLLTTMTAVAVAEAIEELSDKKAQIKWVNDVYIDGKKVSGILTEASFDIESNSLSYVIIGIGINVITPIDGFPSDIKNIATSVFDNAVGDIRNSITASVLNKIMHYYDEFENSTYIDKYIERSNVIGKKITVISGNISYSATAVSIDKECRLQVVDENGQSHLLSSGEISIKL